MRYWTILLLGLVASSLGVAQPRQDAGRPKLGLALSGGAAKGFAHIGVLKVLEAEGLRPDFITGTSMGGIVGGLYAAGYSAEQLEDIALRSDWGAILSDALPLREVAMEEKPFFKNHLLEVPLKNWTFKLPSAVVKGQQIDLILERLCLPVYDVQDFNRLPIPFHCLATDVVSGRAIVLREGDLATALRASMSIPTLFPPITLDSMLLVDGGVLRNFPVEDVINMGANLVIGVNVGDMNVPLQELYSATNLLMQTGMVNSITDFPKQRGLCDLFIQPDFGEFTAADFDAGAELIALGEAAARAKLKEIRQLKMQLAGGGGAALAPDGGLPPLKDIRIDSITITGNHFHDDRAIKGRLGISEGLTIAPTYLDSTISLLYGSNYYDRVIYSLNERAGENLLHIEATEKSPTFLKLSLLFDNYNNAGLLLGFTARNLLLNNSRLMLVGRVANNYRAGLSYLKFLGDRQLSWVRLAYSLERDELPYVWNNTRFGGSRFLSLPLEADLQFAIARNATFSLGGLLETLILKSQAGDLSDFERLRLTNLSGRFQIQVNTLDRQYLPKRGIRMGLDVRYTTNLRTRVSGLAERFRDARDSLFQIGHYPRIQFYAKSYLPLGERFQLGLDPYFAFVPDDNDLFYDNFWMGSPFVLSRRSLPFVGVGQNDVIATLSAGAQLNLGYFLRDDLQLAVHASNGYFRLPPSRSEERSAREAFVSGFSFSGSYHSILGPVRLDLMYPLYAQGVARSRFLVFVHYGYRFGL